MTRMYTRKIGSRRYKDYEDGTLEKCLAAIRSKDMSQREASKHFNIPRRTIINKLKGKHLQRPGMPPVFTNAEEKAFVDCTSKMSDYGFPLTEFDLRMIIKDYLEQKGRKVSMFKDNVPGHDWILSFRKRHPDLSQRLANNIKKSRAAVTANDLKEFISFLSKKLEGVPPSNIFNCDETNLIDEPGRKMVLVRRGSKYVEHIRNTSRTGTSVMFCGSASGQILPLFVVYKSKQMWDTWKDNGPPGTHYRNSLSGWFDSALFLEWFQFGFLPEIRKLSGKKVIVCDNLGAHISLKVVELCERNNVAFICLPPNSSHITQPLDVAVFRGVKGMWRKILSEWKDAHENENITKQDTPQLLKELLQRLEPTLTQNLQSGFRACGIYPTNVDELLKRIPSQDLLCDHDHEVIQSCFISNLEKKRREWTEKRSIKRRKKVNVTPGKALEFSDFSGENTQPSTSKTAKRGSKRRKAESESEDDTNDQEHAFIQDESDPEDWETYCQNQLAEAEEEEPEVTAATERSILKPVVKEIGQHCIVRYDGSFYPGVILSFDQDTAKVSTMTRGLKSCKWPEKEDILDYKWEDVMGSIAEPRCISKTRKLFSVPEMTYLI